MRETVRRVAHTTRFSLCGDWEFVSYSCYTIHRKKSPLKPKTGLNGPPVLIALSSVCNGVIFVCPRFPQKTGLRNGPSRRAKIH